MSFQLAFPLAQSVGRSQDRPLAAAQAFNAGALILVDANGAVAECAADPAAIAGVAESGCGADTSGFNVLAKKEFPPGRMQFFTVKNRQFSCKYIGGLPAADGATYGVTKDADGDWKVDFTKNAANQRVKLIGRRTSSPENIARVIVEVLDANVQII